MTDYIVSEDVLKQAAERGEAIEYRLYGAKTWKDIGGAWNFSNFDYRIAPKKATLVEELRSSGNADLDICKRAADRICELERVNAKPIEFFTADELIDELKRRITGWVRGSYL